jgi:hypothetical protein
MDFFIRKGTIVSSKSAWKLLSFTIIMNMPVQEKPNVEISTRASENSHVALSHNNITNISIIYINTKYRVHVYCIIKECGKRGPPLIRALSIQKTKLNRNNSTKQGSRVTKV